MDLYDTSTFAAALEGSDYIFYTHPLQARADRAYLVGEVGKVAAHLGVKRVVWNTSSWIPDKPGDPFTYAGNTQGINACGVAARRGPCSARCCSWTTC